MCASLPELSPKILVIDSSPVSLYCGPLTSNLLKFGLSHAPFKIGGVVVRSPLLAIAAFEIEKGLPKDYINVSL